MPGAAAVTVAQRLRCSRLLRPLLGTPGRRPVRGWHPHAGVHGRVVPIQGPAPYLHEQHDKYCSHHMQYKLQR